MIRKKLPSNIDQSVRLPCIIDQNPSLAKTSNFVVAMATIIIKSGGILANRVSNPNKMNMPQTISNVPTNEPRKSGDGSPIFSIGLHPEWQEIEIFECLLKEKLYPPVSE